MLGMNIYCIELNFDILGKHYDFIIKVSEEGYTYIVLKQQGFFGNMYDTLDEGLEDLDKYINKLETEDLDESFNSAKEVEKFLVDLFKEKKIWHEFFWEEVEGIKVLCVDVEGDWKHDHAYVDHIMKENGFKLITKVAARGQTGCDGGDWYRAIHIYESPIEENL